VKRFLVYLFLAVLGISPASAFDCLDFGSSASAEASFPVSPTDDFSFRDRLPQTEIPWDQWSARVYGSFGPCPSTFPPVRMPQGDSLQWSQERVVAAAKKYIGLPYKHHHIPAMGGLDCSNFTAWVYNYAFGLRFTSNVLRQSETAGRLLDSNEDLAPGDLMYFFDKSRQRISHVAIYVDEKHVIDASGGGVKVRQRSGRYLRNFAWARRVLE